MWQREGDSFAAQEAAVEDITFTKFSDPPFAQAGEETVWTITVTNPTDVAIDAITVTDNVPDYFEILAANASRGTVTVSGQAVTLTLDQLQARETLTITVNVRLRTDRELPLIIANGASLAVRGEMVASTGGNLLRVSELPSTGQSPYSQWRIPVFAGAATVIALILVSAATLFIRSRAKGLS
jgi:uncharacterized repeat protein (TIGR01451 family)